MLSEHMLFYKKMLALMVNNNIRKCEYFIARNFFVNTFHYKTFSKTPLKLEQSNPILEILYP